MIALVRRCQSFPKMTTHLGVIQIIFVWLVTCSSSSFSIRIDGTLLDRSTELRIHVFCDAEHVFASCSYLCHKVYQPLF